VPCPCTVPTTPSAPRLAPLPPPSITKLPGVASSYSGHRLHPFRLPTHQRRLCRPACCCSRRRARPRRYREGVGTQPSNGGGTSRHGVGTLSHPRISTFFPLHFSRSPLISVCVCSQDHRPPFLLRPDFLLQPLIDMMVERVRASSTLTPPIPPLPQLLNPFSQLLVHLTLDNPSTPLPTLALSQPLINMKVERVRGLIYWTPVSPPSSPAVAVHLSTPHLLPTPFSLAAPDQHEG
jgi:hypothetical protein